MVSRSLHVRRVSFHVATERLGARRLRGRTLVCSRRDLELPSALLTDRFSARNSANAGVVQQRRRCCGYAPKPGAAGSSPAGPVRSKQPRNEFIAARPFLLFGQTRTVPGTVSDRTYSRSLLVRSALRTSALTANATLFSSRTLHLQRASGAHSQPRRRWHRADVARMPQATGKS